MRIQTGIAPHPGVHAIRTACENDAEVASAFLLGSAARGEAIARSDLDVAVVAQSGRRSDVAERLVSALRPAFALHLSVRTKNKCVLYSSDLRRKIDLFVVEDIAQVARYFTGSRIKDPGLAVLMDRTGELRNRLAAMPQESDDLDSLVDEHLTRFASFFESASGSHARSDMYRAQFSLHVAIESVAALAWLGTGRRGFLWAPPDLRKALPEDLQLRFADLTLGLRPDSFQGQKQAVLDLARDVATRLGHGDDPRLALCDAVLQRDRFWNHRDAATYTDERLARGVLLRGSSPHRYVDEPSYRDWLTRHGVGVRIDLRGRHEKAENPVVDLGFEVIEAPVDPWTDFRKDDLLHEGVDSHEASYRFTALRCGHALRSVVEAVGRGRGAVFVHCNAGVDRTGVIVALAHRLAGVELPAVLSGYSGSSDLERTARLSRVLALVDVEGGVEELADRSGIDADLVGRFRERMWALAERFWSDSPARASRRSRPVSDALS